MVDTDKNYVGDEAFWEKYIKGRPPIPESFFQHICKYHATHGGGFGVVHDVGAGVGVHSARLAKYFDHVIVSDVVAENVRLAQQRLGTDKYSYRAAKLEDAGDLEESSVDMIFASFVMHFAHFDEAFAAFAKQLKPGGTFVALICAIPHFADQHVLELWRHIWFEGLRVLLNHAADRNDRLRTLGNVASGYDTMPLPEKYFLPGAQRIALNAGRTSWPPMLPDDLWAEYHSVFGTSTGVGPNDQFIYTDGPDWAFAHNIGNLQDHMETLPFFQQEPAAFQSMWKELEELMAGGRIVEGAYPARIILATRK